MSDEKPRWSGYETQSPAWKAGYDWATDRGDYFHLDALEASEAAGIAIDDEVGNAEWEKGAEFGHLERSGN